MGYVINVGQCTGDQQVSLTFNGENLIVSNATNLSVGVANADTGSIVFLASGSFVSQVIKTNEPIFSLKGLKSGLHLFVD